MLESFDIFQNADGEVSLQLEQWMKSWVGKYEDHQPNWLRVARCINQAIVFPAVFHMKKLLTDKYAYKDSKGSWKVRVSILNKDTIEIHHRKGEKSQLTGAQDNFSFSWSITFRLDLALNDIDVSISIIDYIFDKEMDKNIRTEILNSMQPFLSGSAPYLAIWRKPLRKLPVARDFGRLCNHLSVFNHLGRAIHTRTPDVSGPPLIRKVLLTLADCFNPELVPGIEESLDRHFKDDGELIQMLTKVLHEDKVVPDDSHLAAVLKCINTTIVFPSVDFLHSRVYEKVRYKDVRGTWATHVTLGPAIRGNASTPSRLSADLGILSSSSPHSPAMLSGISPDAEEAGDIPRYRYVSIIHRKVEQAYSPDPKDQFQFEWTVEFVLNREMSIKDVQMGVVDFSFGPLTSEETKTLVLSTLKPFLKPSAFQTEAASLTSHDIIDVAIKKVEELELLTRSLVNGYHPSMPHSVNLRSLLQLLKTSTVSSEVRMVSGESMKAQTETERRSPGSGRLSLQLLPGQVYAGSSESPPNSIEMAGSFGKLNGKRSPPGSIDLDLISATSRSEAKSPRRHSEKPKRSPREVVSPARTHKELKEKDKEKDKEKEKVKSPRKDKEKEKDKKNKLTSPKSSPRGKESPRGKDSPRSKESSPLDRVVLSSPSISTSSPAFGSSQGVPTPQSRPLPASFSVRAPLAPSGPSEEAPPPSLPPLPNVESPLPTKAATTVGDLPPSLELDSVHPTNSPRPATAPTSKVPFYQIPAVPFVVQQAQQHPTQPQANGTTLLNSTSDVSIASTSTNSTLSTNTNTSSLVTLTMPESDSEEEELSQMTGSATILPPSLPSN
jgi:hypothetical protein